MNYAKLQITLKLCNTLLVFLAETGSWLIQHKILVRALEWPVKVMVSKVIICQVTTVTNLFKHLIYDLAEEKSGA